MAMDKPSATRSKYFTSPMNVKRAAVVLANATMLPSPVVSLASSSSSSSTPNKRSRRSKSSHQVSPPRTQSFAAVLDPVVQPHTLILGTHPSIQSLEKQEYYGHALNAFWWIAGDCLGFRRALGVSPSTGQPYQLTSAVRHDNLLDYEQQLATLTEHGFALWDIIAACRRPGSLDQDIVEEQPNAIRELCQDYSSIRRIVIANGGTGSTMFKKHFKDWLASGELRAGPDEFSQRSFGKAARGNETARITLVSAISVSPAAAKYSYEQKRDFWETHVYQPGLSDCRAAQSTATVTTDEN